jgi:hypothetical protein
LLLALSKILFWCVANSVLGFFLFGTSFSLKMSLAKHTRCVALTD